MTRVCARPRSLRGVADTVRLQSIAIDTGRGMAVKIKTRAPGQLSRADTVTTKIVKEFGADYKFMRTPEQAKPFAYKLPERVFIADLMTVFDRSESAIRARIRAHEIPRPDDVDGRRPFWHKATIEALLIESPFERSRRIDAARAQARKIAAARNKTQGDGNTRAKARAIVNARIASIPKEPAAPGKKPRGQHLRAIK